VVDPHESRRKDDNPPAPEAAEVPEIVDGEVVGTTRDDNVPASQDVTVGAEDAAAFRQFQQFLEFQKFQEWQRQHGEAPAAEAPARPWWKRALLLLRYKAVRRLLYFVAALVLIYTVINHLFGGGSSHENAQASRVPGNDNPGAAPPQGANPQDPLIAVYVSIGYGNPQAACGDFTTQGQAQFAAENDAPNCTTAMQGLNHQVADPSAYKANAYYAFHQNPVTGVNGQAEVPACSITVQGGPHLGTFHLHQLPNGGWVIDGYQRPPAQCPSS
jgi:hypothetical protein